MDHTSAHNANNTCQFDCCFIFPYVYEYRSLNIIIRFQRGRKVQVGFEDSNSGGCNRLVSQIEKHNVCLSPACIFSCQQVVSMHTCNHYHHTAGLPQRSIVACCEHGVLRSAGSEIVFSGKTKHAHTRLLST